MRYAFTRASRKDSRPNSPTLHRGLEKGREDKSEVPTLPAFLISLTGRWCLHYLDRLTKLLFVLRLGRLRFFLCRFRGSDRGFGFGFGEGSHLDVFQTRDG